MAIRSGIKKLMACCGINGDFFTFSDVVIDPVALQAERWFLGNIYGYRQAGIHFGVPLANFAWWAVVGFLSLLGYRWMERGPNATDPIPRRVVIWEFIPGSGLYYAVLAFSLGVTFWIGEMLMGIVGSFIFVP